jgi:predicted RNase H-like HicB family nuclease
MSEKLIARVEPIGEDGGYLAYIDSIKGMVESANTPELAMKELLISLKVKLAYDLGISYDALKDSVLVPLEQYAIEHTQLEEKGYTEKEIKFNLCVGA